jgi:ribosomal protein S12 methylthiotransferase
MRRPGHKEFYLKLLNKIRENIDNVVIRSTFIVGHPYEEDEDFQELLSFLEKVKIERAGFFKYYREYGTLSYSLPQVNYKIKQKRYNEVVNLQDEILKEWSIKQINKEYRVLIEAKDNDYFLGRAYFDAPEVDSIIKIKINKNNKKIKIGNFYDVKITDYNHKDYEFYGELVLNKK